MVRGIGLAAFHGGNAEKCVVVLETDVDEGLNRSRDLLEQEGALGGDDLLLRNQIAIENDELRVGEERVAAPFELNFSAALLDAERFIEAERNARRLHRRFELLESALRRVDERGQEFPDAFAVHRRLNGKAADASLFEERKDLARQLVLVGRQPQLVPIDEKSPVLGLQRDAAFF